MTKTRIIILLLSAVTLYSHGQIGGTRTLDFLNLNTSARIMALGGKTISIYDDDLNFAFYNPSLLNEQMDNHLVLNYVNYFTDIKYGYAGYARNYGKTGNFGLGVHYVNYGEFPGADHYGNRNGNFSASEYAFHITWSYAIDSNLNVGATLKPIYSHLERYTSGALAIDLGITWHSDDNLFAASLVGRNIGTQFKGYYRDHLEPLPAEIIAGVSQKFRHAPFRLIATFHQLQKPDLSYELPGTKDEFDPFTGEKIEKSKIEQIADITMRHFIAGIEFMPLKSFHIRAGYNYQRRKELQIANKAGAVGFSWGFGINLKRFIFSYGQANFHLAGSTHHFSLSTNLSSF